MDDINHVSYLLANFFRAKTMKERKKTLDNLELIFRILPPQRIFGEFYPMVCSYAALTEKEWKIILLETTKLSFHSFTDDDFDAFIGALKLLSLFEAKIFVNGVLDMISICVIQVQKQVIQRYFYDYCKFLIAQSFCPCQALGALVFSRIVQYLDAMHIEAFFSNCSELYSTDNIQVLTAFIQSMTESLHFLPDANQRNCFSFIEEVCEREVTAMQVYRSIAGFLVKYAEQRKDEVEECLRIGDFMMHSPNWIVRKYYIERIHQITSCVFSSSVLSVFKEAVIDPINEVRATAAKEISKFSIENEVDKKEVMDIMNKFLQDKDSDVKEEALLSVGALVASLGTEFAMDSVLSSISDDDQLVKLAAIGVMESEQIPLDDIIDAMIKGLTSFGWREKVKISEVLLLVLSAQKDQKQLPTRIVSLIGALIHDQNAAVRNKVAALIGSYMSLIGDKIDKNIFINLLSKAAHHSDYQIRQTAIQSISNANLNEECKDTLEELVKDRVPNVRLYIARYAPMEIAKLLSDDEDEDVVEEFNKRL